MDTSWKPWETYADLTGDRLIVVADLLRVARDEAVDDHRPTKGETALSLGVSGWERSKFALCQARSKHTWLRIANGEAPGATHFIFQVGAYGIRFYHGEPDAPPARYRTLTLEEKGASQGALDLGQMPDGHALRFAVTTGLDFRVLSVSLIEFEEDTQETVRQYRVPLTSSKVTPFIATKEGVELSAPTVAVVEATVKKTGEQG